MRTRSILLLTTVLTCSAWGQTYTISTLAGTGMPVNVPGTSASLGYGSGLNKGTQYIAVDPAGNVFFPYGNTVLRLDATTGMLTLSAGNGTPGFSGDNGPASSAQLNSPAGVAVDSAGNLYIADTQNQRIRKVSNGVITTLAGNGTYGFSGDNGPATSAQLNDPSGIAVDSAGNLYVCESIVYQRIRKVSNGVITTVAGGGSSLGDNGPATSAQLNQPEAVAVDSAGNLYIADTFNNRIRKVSGGVITTVAGNGTPVNSGDNGPATSAGSGQPNSVAVDSAGNLYIAANGDSIRKVSGGFITTVAGGGGTLGDDGPATSGQLQCSCGVAVDSAGNLYIADSFNERIRKVSGGVITTVAGNGTPGLGGDNGPATSGQLYGPAGVAVDSAGNVYIADTSNFLVRKVSGGVITTVAGGGSSYLGDNVPAASVHLYSPSGVAVDSAGNLYIADTGNQIVREVSGGVITTVAGSGASIYGGFSGDNGPATSAQLSNPAGVAVDAAGNLYIADSSNDRIRKVANGVITTVVGTGTPGFAGDNGPATSAELSAPNGVAVDSAGNLYIADTGDGRIRKVSNGVITTVAGGGSSLGDNGPATSAQIGAYGVAVDSAGNLYIADGARVRKVANGVITTVAGNGTAGFGGDNGPATGAQLANATGVAVDSAGNLYVADKNNYRVRVLTPVGSTCTYSVSPTTLPAPASGGSLTVGIQVAPSCPWAISGLPGWITASATSSGPGSASVALAVFPNNSGATLSGTVLIAGVSVTVIQPAAAAAPLPPIKSVVNAASFIGGPVSPGEMVTIFGTGIGPATAAYASMDPATGKLATTIGGVEVLFNGTPAPMIYASSTQVSAVVPYEMAVIPSPSVWIEYSGETSNAYRLSLAASAPGLFAQNSSGSGLGAILNQDNSLNGPGNPAAKGSIVQMFMTGEGQTSPLGVTGTITSVTLPPPQVTPAPLLAPVVQIDGRTAFSTYAGEAPGMAAGVMQLNVQIPTNAGSGALPIQVWFLFNVSQSGITVAVQ